jgi:hypothetical protein
MPIIKFAAAFALATALALPGAAEAAKQAYVYTGSHYSFGNGCFASGGHIQIKLSFSAKLPANMIVDAGDLTGVPANVTLLKWQYSDGVNSFASTSGKNAGITLWTDGSGTIVNWYISLYGSATAKTVKAQIESDYTQVEGTPHFYESANDQIKSCASTSTASPTAYGSWSG